MRFQGFPAGKVRLISVPAQFFTQLLPAIDHLGELKVTLYAFWHLSQQEGTVRYLTHDAIAADEEFMRGLAPTLAEAEAVLADSLKRAVERGIFLRADLPDGGEVYFLNTPKGRAALEAVKAGRWLPGRVAQAQIYLDRPNIFRLYEENIGPLTPLIAEQLEEAAAEYPAAWIEEAFRIAIVNNVRRWRYIEAILKRWKEEGRDDQDSGGNPAKERIRYLTDKFSDFYE